MASSTPARLYCTLVGAVLVIAGIIGFFYSASFDTGATESPPTPTRSSGSSASTAGTTSSTSRSACSRWRSPGRRTARAPTASGIGLVYVVLAIWGFIDVATTSCSG